MKEPEGEGPPRPSLQLLPLAGDPKGGRKRPPARRRRDKEPGTRADAPREGERENPEEDG
jgi:hypothetical protein